MTAKTILEQSSAEEFSFWCMNNCET